MFPFATHLLFNLPAYLFLGYNFNKYSKNFKVFNACEKILSKVILNNCFN